MIIHTQVIARTVHKHGCGGIANSHGGTRDIMTAIPPTPDGDAHQRLRADDRGNDCHSTFTTLFSLRITYLSTSVPFCVSTATHWAVVYASPICSMQVGIAMGRMVQKREMTINSKRGQKCGFVMCHSTCILHGDLENDLCCPFPMMQKSMQSMPLRIHS